MSISLTSAELTKVTKVSLKEGFEAFQVGFRVTCPDRSRLVIHGNVTVKMPLHVRFLADFALHANRLSTHVVPAVVCRLSIDEGP